MNISTSRPQSRESGSSLLMAMIFIVITLIVLGATLGRTYSVSKLNDRNTQYIMGEAAAEAATEKVATRMMTDFANGGLTTLSNNLDFYKSMVPVSTENDWWTNFAFSDGRGNSNKTYIGQLTTNANPPFVALESQYPGLNAFATTWRILSNVRPLFAGNYVFTNAVQQDVQMAEIPIFQFAIFYNADLEFSGAATMTVSGRVHSNTNIDIGSSKPLVFNNFVTTSGIITNPPRAGSAQSSWSGSVTYSGTPSPGWGTGEPVLTLPIGANGTNNSAASVIQVIYPPPANESQTNSMSSQRFYNKAFMVIMTSNNSVNVTLKNDTYDSSPLQYVTSTTNWTNMNFNFWLTTNAVFWDARQVTYVHTTQIDVGRLCTWMSTNLDCTTNRWLSPNYFNGIIYAADWRDTNNSWLNCVRLTNGASINTNFHALPWGLTVATPNPLYTIGHYNTNGAGYPANTYPNRTAPAAFVCDAYTELSSTWSDSTSTNGSSAANRNGCTSRDAAGYTVINAAILTGNVPSTGTDTLTYSGGVHNLTRFLEDWSTSTNYLNTSLVCMYPSAQASDQFVQPTGNASSDYYEPPTRFYSFNTNYYMSVGLPPGTPRVDRMIRATWCNAAPNSITYAPPPTLDFPAQ